MGIVIYLLSLVLYFHCVLITQGSLPKSREWPMLFRASTGCGQSVLSVWEDNVTSHDEVTLMSLDHTVAGVYKNPLVHSSWENIIQVRYSFVTNQQEVAYVLFDSRNSTKFNWFNKLNILESSYSDLTATQRYNHFSITGLGFRRFLIHKSNGGCNDYKGWFLVTDRVERGCAFERFPTKPRFLYSPISTFRNAKNYQEGDLMVLYGRLGCTAPPPRSAMSIMNSPTNGMYVNRTVITYQCVDGTILPNYKNQQQATCQVSSDSEIGWQNLPEKCVAICPEPPPRQNLTISNTKRESLFIEGVPVLYECGPGTVYDRIQALCDSTGQWLNVPENGICQACPPGTFGFNCEGVCDNCNSNDCEAQFGVCKGGCKPGWGGRYCHLECDSNDDTCSQAGQQGTTTATVIGVVVALLIISFCVIAILLVVIVRLRRNMNSETVNSQIINGPSHANHAFNQNEPVYHKPKSTEIQPPNDYDELEVYENIRELPPIPTTPSSAIAQSKLYMKT